MLVKQRPRAGNVWFEFTSVKFALTVDLRLSDNELPDRGPIAGWLMVGASRPGPRAERKGKISHSLMREARKKLTNVAEILFISTNSSLCFTWVNWNWTETSNAVSPGNSTEFLHVRDHRGLKQMSTIDHVSFLALLYNIFDNSSRYSTFHNFSLGLSTCSRGSRYNSFVKLT